jgi:hypothetical protein
MRRMENAQLVHSNLNSLIITLNINGLNIPMKSPLEDCNTGLHNQDPGDLGSI